jgi:3-oxoacyl-[acyl-carrier protein] reductase
MLDLQVDYDEAAMVFSGNRFLTVEDIERVIFNKVLPKKPPEVAIPFHRGWIARITNLFPNLAAQITPMFTKKGQKELHRIRKNA